MKRKFLTCAIAIICTAMLTFSGILPAAASNTTPTSAGIVAPSSTNLNVRSSASTSSTVLTSLAKGSYVSIIELSGNFYKVLYASGKVGYCHKDYISIVTGSQGAYVNTASTVLNVRSGPSTSYSIQDAVWKGESIVVLSSHGTFYKILYRGTKVGYASAAYITLRNTGGSNSTQSGAVKLDVPSYKQYDSRWSGVYLGNSSRTIYQAGCLTTAIAMERSYSYGYTVRPDTVAKTETYTSGGSIYWPSEYTFIYSSSYLTTIRDLLKSGKPVIVGCKNSYGGQHWVVVTGYTPNGSVTADDFTINDPGSSARKTLSSFLSAYPTFYKAAYRK